MKADGDGHRIGGEVIYGGLHLQGSTSQPVSHGDVVGEGELRHQLGVLPEFQAAGGPGRLRVGIGGDENPVR